MVFTTLGGGHTHSHTQTNKHPYQLLGQQFQETRHVPAVPGLKIMVYACMVVSQDYQIFTVAAQEDPGIVIAQMLKLLCNVTRTSNNEVVAWLVNNWGEP